MHMRPHLNEADVILMCEAARGCAAANGWRVTIAVVDEGGALLRLERMDGTGAASSDIATGKAKMAAISRRKSKDMEERIAERPVFLKLSYGLPIQGGLPILFETWCLGGIGVSGVQSHQDELIAQAALDALLSSAAVPLPDRVIDANN
ncbi:heme-binding protein [Rhizobium sp. CG5]|uniref:GlcG/HbpS family heme-binding protein n=1 Tax=Rhizobium sp. CG5 TaxID=2726076 RepID=UPI002034513E|nr:heme-binding protein [Rhizobium sp. CG5]MCM2472417.1 heme-binding protein [Rhizobium sp. CG5]